MDLCVFLLLCCFLLLFFYFLAYIDIILQLWVSASCLATTSLPMLSWYEEVPCSGLKQYKPQPIAQYIVNEYRVIINDTKLLIFRSDSWRTLNILKLFFMLLFTQYNSQEPVKVGGYLIFFFTFNSNNYLNTIKTLVCL